MFHFWRLLHTRDNIKIKKILHLNILLLHKETAERSTVDKKYFIEWNVTFPCTCAKTGKKTDQCWNKQLTQQKIDN